VTVTDSGLVFAREWVSSVGFVVMVASAWSSIHRGAIWTREGALWCYVHDSNRCRWCCVRCSRWVLAAVADLVCIVPRGSSAGLEMMRHEEERWWSTSIIGGGFPFILHGSIAVGFLAVVVLDDGGFKLISCRLWLHLYCIAVDMCSRWWPAQEVVLQLVRLREVVIQNHETRGDGSDPKLDSAPVGCLRQ